MQMNETVANIILILFGAILIGRWIWLKKAKSRFKKDVPSDVWTQKSDRNNWLEDVKEIANRIESCQWTELPILLDQLREIDGSVGIPHVSEFMYLNAGIGTHQDNKFCRSNAQDSNEALRLEDYSLEELRKIILLLWVTIPDRIKRRIRRHLNEIKPEKVVDELNAFNIFEKLKIGSINYDLDIWPSVIWDIAKEDITVALEKEKEHAYGIILRDSSIGLYKIILRQNASCGYMQIRLGNYSHTLSSNGFAHFLKCKEDKAIELENDLCELWLSKLAGLRKTGLTKSRRFPASPYEFAVYSSDSSWSLESFDYHYAFSKNDWELAWKNKVEELVQDIILRADREKPLWKRRDFIDNIASIPDKYSIQKGLFEITFSPSFETELTVLMRISKNKGKLIARYGDKKEEYEIRKEAARNFLKAINYLSKVPWVRDNRGICLDGIGVKGLLGAGSNIVFSFQCHSPFKTEPPREPRSNDAGYLLIDSIIRGLLSVGSKFSFRCHSPSKINTPKEYAIVEAVFYVFNSIKLSLSLQNYLKRLSRYFL